MSEHKVKIWIPDHRCCECLKFLRCRSLSGLYDKACKRFNFNLKMFCKAIELPYDDEDFDEDDLQEKVFDER